MSNTEKKYMTQESTQALINRIKTALNEKGTDIPVYTQAEYDALDESEKPAVGELYIISDDDVVEGNVIMYNSTGQNTDGTMTQKAITDALELKGLRVTYNSETQAITIAEVNGRGDDISYDPDTQTIIVS